MLAKIEDGIIKVISEGAEETEALNKWCDDNADYLKGAGIAFAADTDQAIRGGVITLEDCK